ncbi:hypothetical protein FB567DRAFT_627698 [Paraphoma chrysanthemicola]|uniref:Mid2 domain-containing protein n=1 Tax=Paraphoma chrysanthemicola TaxID=798071 RepID=A0A8K0VZL0_9PLEO|nr:hypothetical protein FB567DRAFT_627698 [Paraphoma chrysanthemicola]
MHLLSEHASFSLFLILTVLSYLDHALTPHPCYYSTDSMATDDLLPCYASTFSSHYSCCRHGDKCLEHGACYDEDTKVTYQYGCTDPSFKDIHCPQKCNLDVKKSRWVGLVFCNGTNGMPADQWICNHPDNCKTGTGCHRLKWRNSIETLPNTYCEDIRHDEAHVAIYTTQTLSDTAALPSPSRTSSWWSANADRPKTVAALTMASSTPLSNKTSDVLHARNKKLALGLGVGLGIPIILLATFLILFYIRKYRKHTNTATPAEPTQPTFPPDGKNAMPALGYKAEVDGSSVLEGFMSPPPPSEMEGSSVTGTPFVSPVTVHEEFESVQRGSGMKEERGTKGGRHEMAG